VTDRAVVELGGAHDAAVRFHAVLLLIGLLTFSAFATETEGPYTVLGIGGASCGRLVSHTGAWIAGLERATCDLDDGLLWIQNYYRAEPAHADQLIVRSRRRPFLRH